MTMFLAPYTAIADIDGSPLDAGFIFFGEFGKNPESFPIPVYWDADFAIPAAQPIRTRNGYPIRNGSPCKIYLKQAEHSLVIKNKNLSAILVEMNNKGVSSSLLVRPNGDTVETSLTNIDAELNDKQQQIDEKPSQQYVDEKLDLKAPQETTYTKLEVDSALSAKAPQKTTYTKLETDVKFSAYVGGRKGFTTLALAQAGQSTLTANTVVDVTNDPDPAKNGTYQWNGTALTKSDYDPANQVMRRVEQTIKQTNSSNLVEFKDADGIPYIAVDNLKKVFIDGIPAPLQDIIFEFIEKSSILEYQDNSAAFDFKDANQQSLAKITKDSELVVSDVYTEAGSLNAFIRNANQNAGIEKQIQKVKADMIKSVDVSIALKDPAPILQESVLFTKAEASASVIFAPSLCRISKNQFIVFCEARLGGGGDFDPSSVIARKITVNADFSITSEPFTVVMLGNDEHSCINPCTLRVDTGTHAGRIYVYFIKRYFSGGDVTFYKYSDDNGQTWSADVDMTPFIPNMANWHIVAIGPGKAIQLKYGAHAGRIILPAWHGDQNYPASQAGLKSFIMYSDDGGVTYQIGAESLNTGSNECSVAEYGDSGHFMLLTRNATMLKCTEISEDAGLTLKNLTIKADIVTTKVQSGLIQAENNFNLSQPKLIMSTPSVYGQRKNLGLYVSYDNENFNIFKQLSTKNASYSDLAPINETTLIIVYAAGSGTAQNQEISCVIVNLKAILEN